MRVSENCLPRGYRGSSWFDLRAYSLHCQDFVGQSLNLPTPAKVDLQSLAKVDVSRMRYGDDSCGEQDNTLPYGGGKSFIYNRTMCAPDPKLCRALRGLLHARNRASDRPCGGGWDIYLETRRNLHEGLAME